MRAVDTQWLPQRQPLLYKTWHHPTASSTLCRMPHPNHKEEKNTNPIIGRQDCHLIHPCPSEEKEKKKSHLLTPDPKHKQHPTQSLHKSLDQPYEGRNQKTRKRRPQTQ